MESRLKYFPISFFAMILGLSGLVIATHKLELAYNLAHISNYLGFVVLGVYVILLLVYLSKFLKYPELVRAELNHPVKMNFFPTLSISLILLSIVFFGSFPIVSKYMLLVGMSVHLFFTIYIMSAWIKHQDLDIKHKNPAWFIPVVGNVLVPISAMNHFHPDVSWFFFSIGIILWIVLYTIFIGRAIFNKPMPDKLMPTFFILIAPPAIGFLAYLKITGEIDGFAKVLYFFALFTALQLFYNIRAFTKIKFYLSWWAYSFPIAVLSTASFVMYENNDFVLYKIIATGLYVFVLTLILYLAYKTFRGLLNHEICVNEEE